MRYHNNVPGYYVENFGCRATQADGAAIERLFEEQGMVRASAANQAAVVVINSCTVTAAADQDARAAVRRLQRQNPEARIIVTGCYAQRAPEEIASLPGVSLVIGNSHKHQLAEIALKPGDSRSTSFVPLGALAAAEMSPNGDRPIFVSDIFAHTELLAAPVFDAANERTRPNLKIQDGCDNRCSFCVIPFVRGQSRSLHPSRVVSEINALVASGYKEVVISGINLGRWGRDLASENSDPRVCASRFEDLIRSILSKTSLEKLRISSVEPMDWSDELIALVSSASRIAKHAHVPMQSGSDGVLRRMHRKYRPWHYREKIEKIHHAMSDAAIGADVMVGFPGETDAEFEATRQMIADLPFTYLHVFTYSARPGTPAAEMPRQVPVQIARERNRILRELSAQKKLSFMQGFVGKSLNAITLNVTGRQDGVDYTESLTDNYLKLRVRGEHPSNRWVSAHVQDVIDGVLVGEPAPG